MAVSRALEPISEEEEEKAAVLDELKGSRVPVWFTEARHREALEGERSAGDESWKNKERMKTLSVALVVCLNIGVDPPDVAKPHPCARDECWLDVLSMSPTKALEAVGHALQDQYARWQPRARYKLCLDPTVDDVKKLALSLRRNAKDERVLFHYNGHGVPKPTDNGEIWLFNRNFTQYIPLSLYDLHQWLGAPSVLVYDTNNAGLILESMGKFAVESPGGGPMGGGLGGPVLDGLGGALEAEAPRRPGANEVIQLGACGAGELLPTSPHVPADLFTACLTTPIKAAVLCYINQNKLSSKFPEKIWEHLPGSMSDRRTLLGELNWIFTAITDTIAWNTLPRPLFQKLFRQDLLVASLFRNFLLAQRVMRAYNCTPVSSPRLPSSVEHPLWDAWDYALDTVLTPLHLLGPAGPDHHHLQRLPHHPHSDFFASQLRAFEIWLRFGYKHRQPPLQLPVVLQVLLSQVHRVKALELLGRFLDLGPWAVSLALSVGIFPYVLKLLLSKDPELKPLLSFIWAKILAVDPGCHRDLVREDGHVFFVDILKDPRVGVREKTVPAFILSALMDNFAQAQEKLRQVNYLGVTVEILREWEAGTGDGGMVHMWLLIGLGRLWKDYSEARSAFHRNQDLGVVGCFLQHPIPEVRAAAAFALGTLVANHSTDAKAVSSLDSHTAQLLVAALQTESSLLVRKEISVALSAFLKDFFPTFVSLAAKLLKERFQASPPPQPTTPVTPGRAYSKMSSVESPSSRLYIPGLSRVASFDSAAAARSKQSTPSPPPSGTEAQSALFGDLRGILHARLSRNVHESVLLAFLSLTQDPCSDMRTMASTVLTSLLPQAQRIFDQQQALAREMGQRSAARTVDRSQRFVQKTPPTPGHVNTSSPPEANRKATFLVGSPSSRHNSVNEPTDLLDSPAGPSAQSGHRERNPAGAGGRVQPPPPLATPPRANGQPGSPSPSNSSNGTSEPLLSTQFVAWCSRRFTQPLLGSLREGDSAETAWDLAPMENYVGRKRWADLSDWSSSTVQSLMEVSRGEREALEAKTWRLESEKWVQKLEEVPVAMELSPLGSLLFLAFPNSLQLCDTESSARRASFRNGNGPGERLSFLRILNPVTHSFLLTGTDRAVLRLWDVGLATNANITTQLAPLPSEECGDMVQDFPSRLRGSLAAPRLITAWRLFDAPPNAASPPVFAWEEDSGSLLGSGGGLRAVRIWDARREQRVEDVELGGSASVEALEARSLASDSQGHKLIVAGCSDGSVRLFDRRLKAAAANLTTLRDFSSPILRVYLEPASLGGSGRVVAAAEGPSSPAIRIWEPRMYREPLLSLDVEGAGVGDMAVHGRGGLLAVSTLPRPNSHAAVSIFTLKGKRLNTIRYHDGLMGQRIGVASRLAFHPFRLALAAAGEDHMAALYGLNS